METPQKIGFVGLGKMGFPMAGRLAGEDLKSTRLNSTHRT